MVCNMQAVFLLFVLPVQVTYGITVSMNKDITGIEGDNGTYIECTYDRSGVDKITFVHIQAFLNNTHQTVVGFNTDGRVAFTEAGSYLKERITFNPINQTSPNVQLYFTQLLCEDDRKYRCLVSFEKPGLGEPDSQPSDPTHISVKVLPSKPYSLSYLTSVRKVETTSESASVTEQTTFRNLTETTKTQGGNFISSSLPTIDNNILEEGDTFNLLCEGYVGKPPDNLIVIKVRNDGERYIIKAVDNSTTEIPENCTFYQNSTFTVNVTAADNGSVFRCCVDSNINDDQMCIGIEPIDVKYQVRVPELQPSQENLPVTLSCYSTGNPLPRYAWYRKHNNSQSFQFVDNKQNITLQNVSEEGVYRCEVSNTIAGKVYVKESEAVNLIFTATTKPTSPGIFSPALPDNSKVKDRNKTYYLIGGVGGGILFIIIITVILVAKCRGQRKPKQHTDADDRLVHQPSTRLTISADNYCSVSLDDNGNGRGSNAERNLSQEATRKHNDRYLKRQAELNAKTEAQRDHNPDEYAMVNKPKKRSASEQQEDTYQPTEYAQVNKVKNKSSDIQPNDEDHYAFRQEGIYDHANNRRHKQHTASDQYDTPANINKKRSDAVGSVAESVGGQMKQKQVAKVKPSGRADYENAGMEQVDIIKKSEEPNTAL